MWDSCPTRETRIYRQFLLWDKQKHLQDNFVNFLKYWEAYWYYTQQYYSMAYPCIGITFNKAIRYGKRPLQGKQTYALISPTQCFCARQQKANHEY